jgi:chemotaxis signal transduction protein
METQAGGALAPHVVVQIGAARIGIPADCVMRALSAPEHYTPLPRRHGALLGMLAVDGLPVPVIDIACWVALAGAAGVDGLRRVVLLRAGARMAALQVDVLEPMTDLPASAITRLCHDDDPEQLFHSAVVLPDSGEMLALLDVDKLFDLAHSWCTNAGIEAASAVEEQAVAGEEMQTWALLEAGGACLAIRAEHLAEVTPMPVYEAFPGGSGVGLCNWRDSHLAVLPLGRLMGAAMPPAAPLLAVLRLGEQALGLPIHAVRELRQIAADQQGVLSEGRGRLPCLTITDEEGGPLRLVDTEALFAMHPEASLNLALQASGAAGARRNDDTYVVLDAGGKLALPISVCEEVLHAAPEECTPAPAGGAATLNWRGATIAVHDLRKAAPSARKVSLVVLRADPAPVALAVDQVVSMIPPGSAELTRMQRGGESVELLILDEASGSATYRIADPAVLLRRRA